MDKETINQEEIINLLAAAEKLIRTMRNNKKAAIWLARYDKLFPEGTEQRVTIQSDREIVLGCIGLMREMMDWFADYLELRGVELPDDPEDEEYLRMFFPYTEIVQRLLLQHTSHAGGTSTMQKCMELGFDTDEWVEFKPDIEEEEA